MHLSHESRLINCLLDRYATVTTLARPVKDSSDNVVVEFGVSLIQILDFDEIKQIVTTSMWKNYVSVTRINKRIHLGFRVLGCLFANFTQNHKKEDFEGRQFCRIHLVGIL